MRRLSIGLTFFHGELLIVEKTLQQLAGHVLQIYIYANSSKLDLERLAAEHHNVSILGTGENVGLSSALNMMAIAAQDAGSQAIILLDQDTIINEEYVASLPEVYDLLMAELGVAAFFPQLDPPAGYKKHRVFIDSQVTLHEVTYLTVPFAPLSGGMYKLSVLSKIPFSEYLFVDLVDVYWGLTVQKAGHQLLIAPNVRLVHTIGRGIIGFGPLKIPLQSNMRYLDYCWGARRIAADQAIPAQWRLLILLQAAKIVFVWTIFGQKRLSFIRELIRSRKMKPG